MPRTAQEQRDSIASSPAQQRSATESRRTVIHRIIRWLLPAAVVVGASVFGFQIGSLRHQLAQTPALVVSQRSLDFGEAWAQAAFRWTLPITNTTGREIEIRENRSSCRCTAVEPSHLVIPPGQTRTVTLTLDLMPKTQEEASQPVRNLSVTLTPQVPSVPERFRWELHGRIRNPLSVSPRALSVEVVRGTGLQWRDVKVTPEIPLSELQATANSSVLHPEVEHPSDAKEPFVLHVGVVPTSTTGRHELKVVLKPVAEEFGRLPEVTVPVIVGVVEDVQAIPHLIAFGGLPVGETGEDTVILSSRTGKPFQLLEIDCDAEAGIQAGPIGGSPGATESAAQFRVRQLAKRLKAQTSRVRFHVVQNRDVDPVEISVEVRYYGLPRIGIDGNRTQLGRIGRREP